MRTRSERRESLPAGTSHADKATRGRTTTTRTPLSVRQLGLHIDPAERDYLRERLGFKLGKFALRIRRVSVRIVDESGPKGAPALVCRIKVVLEGVSEVVVEHSNPELRAAMDGAVDRAERSARRALQRARKFRR